MIKKKIIAGALALSLILGGTGYAYWTDQLNITTTATTGVLDVTFADLGCLAQYTNEQTGWSIIDGIGTKGYLDASVFVDGKDYDVAFNDTNPIKVDGNTLTGGYNGYRQNYNSVTYAGALVNPQDIKVEIKDAYNSGNTKGSDKIEISVKDIYPGYAQAFRTDILNNGDMAATLSSIKVDTTEKSNAKVEESIGIALYVAGEFGTYDSVLKLADQFDASEIFSIGGVDFVRLSALDDPTEYNNINKDLLCIPSANRMDAILGIAMDPLTEGTDADAFADKTMDGKVVFTVDFDWTQFNAGKEINATANQLVNQNKSAQ